MEPGCPLGTRAPQVVAKRIAALEQFPTQVETQMIAENSPDAALVASLACLWPNREHELSAVAGLLCRVGIHYWGRLDISKLAPGRDVRFCLWCSQVELDGVVHPVISYRIGPAERAVGRWAVPLTLDGLFR